MNTRIILWVGILWGIAVQSAQSQYIVRSNQQDTVKQTSSASVKQRTVNPYDDWMYWWFVPLPKTPPIVIHVESPGDLEFFDWEDFPRLSRIKITGEINVNDWFALCQKSKSIWFDELDLSEAKVVAGGAYPRYIVDNQPPVMVSTEDDYLDFEFLYTPQMIKNLVLPHSLKGFTDRWNRSGFPISFKEITLGRDFESFPDKLKVVLSKIEGYGPYGGEENLAVGLQAIHVAEGNPYFVEEDGILFNSDKTKLIYVPSTMRKDTFSIPESVTEISDYACYNQKTTMFEVPLSVKRIGKYAFYSWGRVSWKASTGNLRTKWIRNIKCIPESIDTIHEGCFMNSSANYIVIPKSVKYIERDAFIDAQMPYPKVYCLAKEPPVCETDEDGYAFIQHYWIGNVEKRDATLYVPTGSKPLYENAEGFGYTNFMQIIELENIEEEALTVNVQSPSLDDEKEIGRYTVTGIKIDKAQKGLNIIKYSNGTTRKVIVK